jgi:hypothetical protein
LGLRGWDKVRPQGPNKFMVVVYDHTVQEHHFFSSGTLMASTCDLLGTKMGETAQCVRQRAPRCRRAPRRQRRRSGGPRPSRGPFSQLLASILGRRTSICASVVELVIPATLSLAKVHFVWPIRSQIMRCNSGETLPAYFRRGRSASRAQKAHGQQPSSRSPRVEATDVPARRAA